MATYVGKVGDTFHYADARLGIFFYRGLHIEVFPGHSKPFVTVRPLGRVRSEEAAVDQVAAVVRRQRGLAALAGEECSDA